MSCTLLVEVAFPVHTNAAPPPGTSNDPLAFGTDGGRLPPLAPAVGHHGMVVSAQHLASEVGAKILSSGGNAVDASVAVAYALAVVYPAAGNIGGGGFMTLRLPDGHTTFIDFREHAPLRATATMYQDAQGSVVPGASVSGWKAVAVPGTVAGMELILKRWGHLSRAKVMAPAIALARDGFVLGDGDVQLLHTSTDVFRRDPNARAVFLHPDGSPLEVGDRLVQTNLAHTLSLIAAQGEKAFYNGPIAQQMIAGSNAGGGILQAADFTGYKARELKPIQCRYRGYTVDTAPPPSGGGVALCEMLNILSGYDLSRLGVRSTEGIQRQIEAMRHAYSDRRGLGDPAFVQNPIAHLIDPDYARQIRAGIPTDQALKSSDLSIGDPLPHPASAQAASDTEKHETTQFSVMDRSGMAVSCTYTLNGWFGAGVIGGNTGVFMNDEMDDFSAKPGASNMFGIVGSVANAIAPGKTPLSSMSPTILSRNGHTTMVVGSPGGSRIPTITLSVILGVIDGGLDIQQAVDLPRIHEQWMPSAIEAEAGAMSDATVAALTKEGYEISPHKPWGVAEAILAGRPDAKSAPTGNLYGGYDRRHPGGAADGL
ncbi:gamma-glutamyltransferase [Neoasaia chiangmaiensis]|uniref:gamma-glutamyltransferase n=1 Tax=Neoasaia chiangmaiensis TaxID=320497 RepID=UPI001FE9458D|nr:gamma-glutamyltransferase [Neoasaia chiangmaiensis]